MSDTKEAMKKQSAGKVHILQALIFLLMVFYFAKWCPLVLYDADDWIYIAYDRLPIPIWGGWNPARVLPETLMPLMGRIAARLFYPITGDYVKAVTWISSVLMATLITVVCYLVYRAARNRLNTTMWHAMAMEILFLAGCYWIFRNRGGSSSLFRASSLCTTYFYTISGLVNAIAILVMAQRARFVHAYKGYALWQKIAFWLLIYCSIFSNLFHSGMLAVYCGVGLLIAFIRYLFGRDHDAHSVRELIVNNRVEFVILVLWIVAVLFELSGGRAGAVGGGEEISLAISLQQTLAMFQAFHKAFLICLVVAVILASYWGYRGLQASNGTGDIDLSFVLLINLIVITAYELLLNAQVHYMSRIEASWGVWFYCVLLVTMMLGRICNRRCSKALPAVVLVAVVFCLYPDGRFAGSNINNVSYEACLATDHLVIDEIMQADAEDDSDVTVHIPDYSNTNSAWGFGENYGQLIADALYHNGVIDQEMVVTTIMDAALNAEIEGR